jgi:hypothetical protein
MENKYYRPEYEEFFEGFEYEREEPYLGVWDKCIFDGDTPKKHFEKYSEEFRVKYLDKEDIESLGFIQGKLPYQYFKDTYRLVDLGDNKYSISQPNLYDDTDFRGIIKNKSELKKVLKMLEIDG